MQTLLAQGDKVQPNCGKASCLQLNPKANFKDGWTVTKKRKRERNLDSDLPKGKKRKSKPKPQKPKPKPRKPKPKQSKSGSLDWIAKVKKSCRIEQVRRAKNTITVKVI